jgi:hypothetical protein
MHPRPQRILAAALLSICCLVASATATAAEPAPLPSPPDSSAGCQVWNAYLTRLVEQHKGTGVSGSALGEALSAAYAAYAICVMCPPEQGLPNEVIALREKVHLVLFRAATLASAQPPRD